MGFVSWGIAGIAVFIASRILPPGRPPRPAGELIIALAAAIAFGLIATALDFGGWNQIDWRAALFAFLGAAAVVGVARVVRLQLAT